MEIFLAWEPLQRASSERYQFQVVRCRLNKMSNEAVNVGADFSTEELCRCSYPYIWEIDTPDTMSSTVDNGKAFRLYFES